MYKPSDRSQFLAYAVKCGTQKLAPEQQEIIDWITTHFEVCPLNFFSETKDGSRHVVHFILETPGDVKKMQDNHAATRSIAERLSKSFPGAIVTYRPFKLPDPKVVQEMLSGEIRSTLKNFESVWTISQNVIFYYTDEQVRQNLSNGTSAKINEDLAMVMEKYGFDRGSAYNFDSKETFDRHYQSDWYHYWK